MQMQIKKISVKIQIIDETTNRSFKGIGKNINE